MKKIYNYITHHSLKSIFILLFLVFVPLQSNAQTVFIASPETPLRVGSTSLVKVMINTGETEINSIEGDMTFSTSRDIVSLPTGGSVFNLWPQKPSLEKGHVVFVGGTPGGIFGTSLHVFSIAVKPSSTKSIEINFKDVIAYLHDGKGTKLVLAGKTIKVPVLEREKSENELASLINNDLTPPDHFAIELGRDSSLYDGKYFITFYSRDAESGISRYEVIEGSYPVIRSGSTYVLQNQNLDETIEVHAIDAAGNIRVETLALQQDNSWTGRILISIFFMLLFGGFYFFIIKKQ